MAASRSWIVAAAPVVARCVAGAPAVLRELAGLDTANAATRKGCLELAAEVDAVLVARGEVRDLAPMAETATEDALAVGRQLLAAPVAGEWVATDVRANESPEDRMVRALAEAEDAVAFVTVACDLAGRPSIGVRAEAIREELRGYRAGIAG